MKFFKFFIDGIKAIIFTIVSIFKHFLIGLYTIITIFPKYFIIGLKTIFGKKKNKNIVSIPTKNKKKVPILLGLSLVVYFICVFLISRWYVQSLKIKYLSKDIIDSTLIIEEEENQSNNNNPIDEPMDGPNNGNETNGGNNNTPVYYPNDYWDYMNVSFMDVNFNELLSKNSDTVGWIKVEGTKVNYPVVQTKDNEYYLNHAFNKSNNIGGWIFADYRVDFKDFGKNTIIYGHNMNNKTMFGSVPNMLYNSYLSDSDNHYIKISTPYSNTVWKVFSVYTIEPEVYYLKTNFRTESFDSFVQKLTSRSIYNFGVDVNADDKILTLSTCDNTGTKRVAVHAKMINIEYK